MKLIFSSLGLLALASASELETPRSLRRLQEDACGVVNFNYGSANSALDDSRGNSDIVVEKDNSADCVVSCDAATDLELYIGYGSPGQVNEGNAEASNTNMNCGDSLSATNSNGEQGFKYIVKASSYTNLRVNCGCPTTDQVGGGGCFSGTDTVQVMNKGRTAMKDLKVGDKVLSANGHYEVVYTFGHYHETQMADFVKLQTDAKTHITMTPNHLVYVNGDLGHPIRADQAKKGDGLSSDATITKVSTVQKQGLFMPLTPSGKILVNNIEASAYISMADYAPIKDHPLLKFWLSEQMLSHLWLSPYRMYCMGVVGNSYCSHHVVKNVEGDNGILTYLLWGKEVAEFAMETPLILQVPMGIAVFAPLLGLYALEMITGPALAPLAVLLLAAMIFRRHRATKKKQKTV